MSLGGSYSFYFFYVLFPVVCTSDNYKLLLLSDKTIKKCLLKMGIKPEQLG